MQPILNPTQLNQIYHPGLQAQHLVNLFLRLASKLFHVVKGARSELFGAAMMCERVRNIDVRIIEEFMNFVLHFTVTFVPRLSRN